MRFIDIAIGAFAIALVLFTVLYNVRKKRRGENSCGGCHGCSTKRKNLPCCDSPHKIGEASGPRPG
ncbi:FeoB-associated Cys-rich membrane protein [Synergistaceae bacterium OttesenSCG-928-I11]|nr:FeoB-associated Cys-rich membrane protein [Synergistaceae bacterium OttesenSCG-928-I11]